MKSPIPINFWTVSITLILGSIIIYYVYIYRFHIINLFYIGLLGFVALLVLIAILGLLSYMFDKMKPRKKFL